MAQKATDAGHEAEFNEAGLERAGVQQKGDNRIREDGLKIIERLMELQARI